MWKISCFLGCAFLGLFIACAEPQIGPSSSNSGGGAQSLLEKGGDLYRSKCVGCHREAGNGSGPSLKGLYGQKREMENGETVVADEDYIKESLVSPDKRIVKGYRAMMPEFTDAEEVAAVVEYIKSLK